MTVASKQQAMDLFDKYRKYLVERARYEAVQLIVTNGVTNSRMVRFKMVALHLMHPNLDERWLGAVFSCKLFEWTGKMVSVHDASPRTRSSGGGGRAIREWKLRPGGTMPQLPTWIGSIPRKYSGPKKPSSQTIQFALTSMRVMHQHAVAAGHIPDPAVTEVAQWLKSIAEEN